MPVFNRIRIINIRYDNREINDELFDYYDGCNALMNLANGSGKTVMVETLFQPIHPNMSVGKWKIIDYLTGDQRPTFVMIEWRLDQTKEPTYFMTGICMSITRFKQEDNQPGKALKYFTFTHTSCTILLKLAGLSTGVVDKAFGNLAYDKKLSEYKEEYRVAGLRRSIMLTEGVE